MRKRDRLASEMWWISAASVVLFLPACGGGGASYRSVVPAWGDLPVESVCLETDETWYDKGKQNSASVRLPATYSLDDFVEYATDEAWEEFPGASFLEDDLRKWLDSTGEHYAHQLDIVDSGCDVTMRVEVVGVPLSTGYETGEAGGRVESSGAIYDGAAMVGTLTLEAEGQQTLTDDFSVIAQDRSKYNRIGSTDQESTPDQVDYVALLRLRSDDVLPQAVKED